MNKQEKRIRQRKKKKLKKRAEKKERDKEYQKRRKIEIEQYQKQISKYNNTLWIPDHKAKYTSCNINSWFDIKTSKSPSNNELKLNNKSKFGKQVMKCIKVEMILDKEQKEIIDKWMMSYLIMYNKTVELIKQRYSKGKRTILSFRTLRTKYLLNAKKEILDFYENINPIKSHSLDYAIKLACANYKSSLTNLQRGHITHFRMRYWRRNKDTKIMDVEKTSFGPNGFFSKIKYVYNKKDFDINGKINHTCKIHFENNQYHLLIPETVKCNQIKKKIKEVISCDPGIRTFMTGISENEIVKIGDNNNKIKDYIKLIDKRNKKDIPNKIKKKNEELYNRKITNIVDEMHWKTIKFLTNNYKVILIGNMSVKGITNNRTSQLSELTKRIAYRLKFYQFRQRLQYKCKVTKTQCELINEKFTSKMCSNCGYVKEDLGASKIYNCNSCQKVMDRDINGARGIYLKSRPI